MISACNQMESSRAWWSLTSTPPHGRGLGSGRAHPPSPSCLLLEGGILAATVVAGQDARPGQVGRSTHATGMACSPVQGGLAAVHNMHGVAAHLDSLFRPSASEKRRQLNCMQNYNYKFSEPYLAILNNSARTCTPKDVHFLAQ